jgi:hypothetical protein
MRGRRWPFKIPKNQASFNLKEKETERKNRRRNRDPAKKHLRPTHHTTP